MDLQIHFIFNAVANLWGVFKMADFETALLWVLAGVVMVLAVTTTMGHRKTRKTVRQIAREREDLRNERSNYDNKRDSTQRPLT